MKSSRYRTSNLQRVWSLNVALLSIIVIGAIQVHPENRPDTKYATLTNPQVQEMLDTVATDIKTDYYDPQFHGVDIDKRFSEARNKIASAKSQDEALLDVAAAVAALKDSHTHFRPPVRPYGVDYGFVTQAIGDSDCYVTAVRPESDAAAKGLKAGDRMLSINGISIERSDLSTIEYS